MRALPLTTIPRLLETAGQLSDWTEWLAKVIRPQDMPPQVANGNFDLAITGRDWLTDHLAMFPSSPVRELADMKMGWVRIVAVVSQDMPADNIYELRQLLCRKGQASPHRLRIHQPCG